MPVRSRSRSSIAAIVVRPPRLIVAQLVELGVDAVAHQARRRVSEAGGASTRVALDRRRPRRAAGPGPWPAGAASGAGAARRAASRAAGSARSERGERHQVARSGGAEGDPAQDPVDVLDGASASRKRPRSSVRKASSSTASSRSWIGSSVHQRPQDPLAQQPRAHARCAVSSSTLEQRARAGRRRPGSPPARGCGASGRRAPGRRPPGACAGR